MRPEPEITLRPEQGNETFEEIDGYTDGSKIVLSPAKRVSNDVDSNILLNIRYVQV